MAFFLCDHTKYKYDYPASSCLIRKTITGHFASICSDYCIALSICSAQKWFVWSLIKLIVNTNFVFPHCSPCISWYTDHIPVIFLFLCFSGNVGSKKILILCTFFKFYCCLNWMEMIPVYIFWKAEGISLWIWCQQSCWLPVLPLVLWVNYVGVQHTEANSSFLCVKMRCQIRHFKISLICRTTHIHSCKS